MKARASANGFIDCTLVNFLRASTRAELFV
jgi:hypothetical protein